MEEVAGGREAAYGQDPIDVKLSRPYILVLKANLRLNQCEVLHGSLKRPLQEPGLLSKFLAELVEFRKGLPAVPLKLLVSLLQGALDLLVDPIYVSSNPFYFCVLFLKHFELRKHLLLGRHGNLLRFFARSLSLSQMVLKHRLLLLEIGAHDSLLPFAVGQSVLHVPNFLVLLSNALNGVFALVLQLGLPFIETFFKRSKVGRLPLHFQD